LSLGGVCFVRLASVDGHSVWVAEQPRRWDDDDDSVQVYRDEPYLDARWHARYHHDNHNRPSQRCPHTTSI